MTNNKERGFIIMPMVVGMKDNGLTIRNRDKGRSRGSMGINT